MLFKEEDSWDGIIDKVVGEAIPQPKYDEEKKFTGKRGPIASSPIVSTPAKTPRNAIQGEGSRSTYQYTPSLKSGNESYHNNRNTRILEYIYDELDANTKFSFIASQSMFYEEAVKQEHWVKSMDKEIDSIERNGTWDHVEFPKDKKHICVKWFFKTKLNKNSN